MGKIHSPGGRNKQGRWSAWSAYRVGRLVKGVRWCGDSKLLARLLLCAVPGGRVWANAQVTRGQLAGWQGESTEAVGAATT